MKSIVKKQAGPGLWLEESKKPTFQDHEVLIKIAKTSLCGTDLNIHQWSPWAQQNVPVPLIVGHEFVGIVVDKGKLVKDIEVGARVSGEGHLTCGSCCNCRKGLKHLCMHTRGIGYHVPGCFAEFMSLPAENVFLLPDYVDDDIASILDPFGNAVHTALAFNLIGEDVLITGAGSIGMMAAAIAKKAGARNIVVTDVNEYRLGLAKQMGATLAVDISKQSLEEEAARIGVKDGFTIGMEMSGKPDAFNTLLKHAQHGANLALLGILPPDTLIDWNLVIFKMLNLKGIYGREIFNTWYQMLALLESGLDLHPIITHEFAADDFEKGFEVMRSGTCGKVILNWT